MALIVPKTQWIWNRLGTKLFFKDITGEYDAALNPGGYGTPNEERSDFALVSYVRYMKSDAGLEGLELNTPSKDYDEGAALDVEFEVDLIDDGWHYMTMFYLPYTQTTENHLYWDQVNKNIMQKKTGGDVVLTKAQVLLLADEYKPLMVDSQDFWQPKTSIFQKTLDDDFTEALIAVQTQTISKLREKLDLVTRLMVAADYRFRSALQAEAQEIVEQLIDERENYNG